MLIDYHIHTLFSDGLGRHEDYINSAIKKKINEIGFSDHFCFKKTDWAMKSSDVSLMVKKVNNLKKNRVIAVKLGVELDFLPGFEDKIKKFIESNPFDYVIGSVHFINNWLFDDRRNIQEYKKWNIDNLYKVYFKLIQKAAESKLFDIMGHPDLIKKLGFKPKNDINYLLEETAEVFRKNKVCIEINSNGLNAPCKEIYPGKEFLKMCFNKGIPITFGSDAHSPERVGQNFDKIVKLVKDIGYTKIVQFTRRKRKFVEI